MRDSAYFETIESLVQPASTRIVFYIADGVGGVTDPERGRSELEAASLPNLDALARRSSVGLMEPVGPGITPGSGPGHLGLFGYDPIKVQIGRGVLAALGIGFDLRHGDIAARVNFCNLDTDGNVTDRRAGRIDDASAREVVDEINRGLSIDFDGEIFFVPAKEHRAVLVFRAEGLDGRVADTDPQKTGVPPLAARARVPEAGKTAELAAAFFAEVCRIRAGNDRANGVLMRGFDVYRPIPSLSDRFGLNPMAIASYPMYRGLSSLVGMKLHELTTTLDEELTALEDQWDSGHDYFFVHYKYTDSRGEDGDFDAKVAALEEFDAGLPRVLALKPDVLVITGDHATPSLMAAHSWHPVPVMISGTHVHADPATCFTENACIGGMLGLRPMTDLMPIALAHAGRLQKFGA
jgi:2,3-bisphosphoglycerate-independent phosphoglycerate mutase